MTYHFMHYFNAPGYRESVKYGLTDDQKIELAKYRAAKDLVNILLENANFEIDKDGNVRGTIVISEENA